MKPKSAPKSWLFGALGLISFLLGWQLLASAKIYSEAFVPAPASVLAKLIETTTVHNGVTGYEGYFLWDHLAITLSRIFESSIIAIALGIPIGIAIGLVPWLKSFLGPGITFLRQLPPLAYFSLLIIWFGINEEPKVILLVLAALPPIVVATADGVSSINQHYVRAARSLGAKGLQLVKTIYLPGALPNIFTGIRLGIGVAYTSVVAAETVNGLPGLGGVIRDAQRYNLTSVVILGIIVLGLTGLLIEFALERIQRSLTPWRNHV